MRGHLHRTLLSRRQGYSLALADSRGSRRGVSSAIRSKCHSQLLSVADSASHFLPRRTHPTTHLSLPPSLPPSFFSPTFLPLRCQPERRRFSLTTASFLPVDSRSQPRGLFLATPAVPSPPKAAGNGPDRGAQVQPVAHGRGPRQRRLRLPPRPPGQPLRPRPPRPGPAPGPRAVRAIRAAPLHARRQRRGSAVGIRDGGLGRRDQAGGLVPAFIRRRGRRCSGRRCRGRAWTGGKGTGGRSSRPAPSLPRPARAGRASARDTETSLRHKRA